MPLLDVNGQQYAVDCDTSTPLLYVLRNDLGLTSARFGCGMGQCGACHVLINGRSVASCDISVDKELTPCFHGLFFALSHYRQKAAIAYHLKYAG